MEALPEGWDLLCFGLSCPGHISYDVTTIDSIQYTVDAITLRFAPIQVRSRRDVRSEDHFCLATRFDWAGGVIRITHLLYRALA